MTPEEYERLYRESLDDPEKYWGRVGEQVLTWMTPFTKVYEPGPNGTIFDGFKWFSDGTLNACYNAVDRHAVKNPDKVALIWEPNDPTITPPRSFTYQELLTEIQKVAGYLRRVGVRKGDRVCLYMPTCPEALFVMLGCARIGAVHNVVFAAMGWEALLARIRDSQSRVVFVANACFVGTNVVRLKDILDEAIGSDGTDTVERVVVLDHTGNRGDCRMTVPRDVWWSDTVGEEQGVVECVEMGAEDELFYLYTSGSTGKPKAMVHTTAGYLAFVAHSFKTVFDVHPETDCFFVTSDVGWVSCHSYGLYGPMVSGVTVVWVESKCYYPWAGRPWDIIRRHNVTHLYTSPTTLRALKKRGDQHVACPTLRVLGSAGEPLDPTTRQWYWDVVGRGECPVVDTYWQTETGGVLIGTIPGAACAIPGHAGVPFMGVQPDIMPLEQGAVGALVFTKPWPGLARTIHGDHERYRQSYLLQYPGAYYSGDGATFTGTDGAIGGGCGTTDGTTGQYRIHGRIDDVINVGPVRFATAEIEGALAQHPLCVEAAVLGTPDPVTGQCVVAFCVLRDTAPANITSELQNMITTSICELAAPKHIYYPTDLPKTRSGKIMRRVLRKILAGERDLGDLSTLLNPEVVGELVMLVRE